MSSKAPLLFYYEHRRRLSCNSDAVRAVEILVKSTYTGYFKIHKLLMEIPQEGEK